MKSVNDEANKVAADILNTDQRRRFRQIKFQHEGVSAFFEPEVQKAVVLTDNQKERIKTINQDFQKDAEEARNLLQHEVTSGNSRRK